MASGILTDNAKVKRCYSLGSGVRFSCNNRDSLVLGWLSQRNGKVRNPVDCCANLVGDGTKTRLSTNISKG